MAVLQPGAAGWCGVLGHRRWLVVRPRVAWQAQRHLGVGEVLNADPDELRDGDPGGTGVATQRRPEAGTSTSEAPADVLDGAHVVALGQSTGRDGRPAASRPAVRRASAVDAYGTARRHASQSRQGRPPHKVGRTGFHPVAWRPDSTDTSRSGPPS